MPSASPALLADTSVEAVAEEVEWGLRSRGADELQGRAGRQRYGYVEPTEAAWEILGEALDPHLKDVERLLRLRMRSAAHDTALGIVAGLYRCRDVDDPELLLSWPPTYQPITPTDRSVCCARPESTFPRASSRRWRRSGQAELERSGLEPVPLISGTSGEKFPRRCISPHIRAHRTR